MKIEDRLIRYCKIDTQSDPASSTTPSTMKQFDLAKILVEELKDAGLQDATLDEHCYIYAHLDSNVEKEVPMVGFVAHMDTAPDFSGKNVNPRIIRNFDGNDIDLGNGIVTKMESFAQMKNFIGKDLIVTDGTTLLGADDKAGIACIMDAMLYLKDHPEVKHGPIAVAFTPDEEIGEGTKFFDVEKFGAKFAYTMDGDTVNVVADETFNAGYATVSFKGFSIHPGEAKNRMINAASVACFYESLMPSYATPEHTEGKEGFIHLTDMSGNIEEAKLSYIIRDHDHDLLLEKMEFMKKTVEYVNTIYGSDVASIETTLGYRNMKEIIDTVPHVSKLAYDAIEALGYTPLNIPIRGGTDGAELSFNGIPCPNLGNGGGNFHGRYEYCVIQELEDASKLIVTMVEMLAKEA